MNRSDKGQLKDQKKSKPKRSQKSTTASKKRSTMLPAGFVTSLATGVGVDVTSNCLRLLNTKERSVDEVKAIIKATKTLVHVKKVAYLWFAKDLAKKDRDFDKLDFSQIQEMYPGQLSDEQILDTISHSSDSKNAAAHSSKTIASLLKCVKSDPSLTGEKFQTTLNAALPRALRTAFLGLQSGRSLQMSSSLSTSTLFKDAPVFQTCLHYTSFSAANEKETDVKKEPGLRGVDEKIPSCVGKRGFAFGLIQNDMLTEGPMVLGKLKHLTAQARSDAILRLSAKDAEQLPLPKIDLFVASLNYGFSLYDGDDKPTTLSELKKLLQLFHASTSSERYCILIFLNPRNPGLLAASKAIENSSKS